MSMTFWKLIFPQRKTRRELESEMHETIEFIRTEHARLKEEGCYEKIGSKIFRCCRIRSKGRERKGIEMVDFKQVGKRIEGRWIPYEVRL